MHAYAIFYTSMYGLLNTGPLRAPLVNGMLQFNKETGIPKNDEKNKSHFLYIPKLNLTIVPMSNWILFIEQNRNCRYNSVPFCPIIFITVPLRITLPKLPSPSLSQFPLASHYMPTRSNPLKCLWLTGVSCTKLVYTTSFFHCKNIPFTGNLKETYFSCNF